ncbi:hypothetical protein pipiens_010090 [Culex pipiens pipiens]|uniref:Uncharacterized protein n=1 Tax=Culex pipiens pipiens TaxID=38569 RepID=A0ABD1DBF8_CULPP
MKQTLTSFIILALATTCCGKHSCGTPLPSLSLRIVNGHHAKAAEWPWHAVILHKKSKLEPFTYACGGSLIHKRYVLTTAHCTCNDGTGNQLAKQNLRVQLGVQRLDEVTEQDRQYAVEEVHTVGEDGSYAGLKNDIALLKLRTKVEITRYVLPVCLPGRDVMDGEMGTVVGFGLTEDDEVSTGLKAAPMPMVEMGQCLRSDRTGWGEMLDEGLFCAGHRNGTTVCNGDSGGGLVVRRGGSWQLGGMVSFGLDRKPGDSRCRPDGFGAFTRVFKYMGWIQQAIATSMSYKSASELQPGVISGESYHFGTGPFSHLQYHNVPQLLPEKYYFSLRFKTSFPEGVLFYAENPDFTNFIALFLHDGILYHGFDFGLGGIALASTRRYDDGKWHSVIFARYRNTGTLVIDGEEEARGRTDGSKVTLNVTAPLFVGGVSEEYMDRLANSLHVEVAFLKQNTFDGCISDILMFEIPLGPPSNATQTISCSAQISSDVFFDKGGGYVLLHNKFVLDSEFAIGMSFKPRSPSGTLFSLFGTRGYFMLELTNGNISYVVKNGVHRSSKTYQPVGENLFEERWHIMAVTIEDHTLFHTVTVQLNGFFKLTFETFPFIPKDTSVSLYLGENPYKQNIANRNHHHHKLARPGPTPEGLLPVVVGRVLPPPTTLLVFILPSLETP